MNNQQKQQIKDLMDDYFDNKSKFKYIADARREDYADSPKTAGKYNLNCGVFAQMIWMGRKISDFTATPINVISKAFDWGYYFQFRSAKAAYGIKKESGYYVSNTYEDNNGDIQFVTYDNAAAMAQELYKLGCEINYADADVGDLVFYRSDNISDGDTDDLEQTSFRYITHVGIVYDRDAEGNLTIIESSNAYKAAIGKCGLTDNVTTFGQVRGANLEQRVVMAARHPLACNVPSKFEKYKGVGI